MVFFFIPALWQGQNVEPTLSLLTLWDGCDSNLTLEIGYFLGHWSFNVRFADQSLD
jgi:hypothetical protein